MQGRFGGAPATVSRRTWGRLGAAAIALAALSVPAAGTQAAQPVPASPIVRVHQLFDTGTGAAPAGVVPGGHANPLVPRIVRDTGQVAGDPGAAARIGAAGTSAPEVLGFAQSGEILGNLWPQDLRLDLLSTVVYFSVHVNPDGSLVGSDSGYAGWASANMTSFMNAAHAKGVRVVLGISASTDGVIGSVTGNEGNRQRLIGALINELRLRGGDGINIDFEGLSGSLSGGYSTFISELHSALTSQLAGQAYLTIDVYASAPQGGTMYDIGTLKSLVDAFDVMAYDFTLPNSSHAGPVAPMNVGGGYNGFTDTRTVALWTAAVPRSQVILGVPYYGYKWSVTGPQPLAQAIGTGSGDSYVGVLADFACAQQLSIQWDANFQEPWATWYSPASGDPCGANRNATRELYYENAQSLGAKYDLVNANSLRGIGIWSLGMDSGSSDFWNVISAKFTVTHGAFGHMTAPSGTQSTRSLVAAWDADAGSPPAQSTAIWVREGTAPWVRWFVGSGSAGQQTFLGFPGHTYQFYAQAMGAGGSGSGSVPTQGTAAQAVTTIAGTAPPATPFTGLWAGDVLGPLHPFSTPPEASSVFSFPIVRGVAAATGAFGGYTLDGYGGVHPFGSSPQTGVSGYWPGWDIARGIAVSPGGTSGYTLDGWGGIHAFGSAPAVATSGYWPGWDIARGIAVSPGGRSGYTVDGWGGIHAFGGAPAVAATGNWPGWDIVRGIVLRPDGQSGYTLDGWGGLHPFGVAGDIPAQVALSGYWPGWDIARGVALIPGSSAGYTVDGYGGIHPFGGAPAVVAYDYMPGRDVVRGLAIS